METIVQLGSKPATTIAQPRIEPCHYLSHHITFSIDSQDIARTITRR